MKVLDIIVLSLFVGALLVLCFFQRCSLDIYFLIFGFAIAIMSEVTMLTQLGNDNKNNQQI